MSYTDPLFKVFVLRYNYIDLSENYLKTVGLHKNFGLRKCPGDLAVKDDQLEPWSRGHRDLGGWGLKLNYY